MPGDGRRPFGVTRAARAYHEAGHAVASWRLKDGIRSVDILDCHTEDEGRVGGSFFPQPADPAEKGGWGFRRLVMLMAGPVAQRAYDPRTGVLSCASGDFRKARDLAFVMSTSREAARALLLWALTEARGRVAADWHLIEALADALLNTTALTGEAAIALLAEAERSQLAAFSELRRAAADDAAL